MNQPSVSALRLFLLGIVLCALARVALAQELRGTGDLGLVVERAKGSIQLIDTTKRALLQRVEGLGDTSHASAVFSRDERYAYVFGRDGGLTKVDLLTGTIVRRVLQSGNSIGGAISQDGRWIAAANYTPGGVKIFDSTTLELVADIPAWSEANHGLSRVVGVADAPGQRFVFSLFDAGETWIADLSADPRHPKLTKFPGIGQEPYDGTITPDGRWYMAGLFGEDGIAVLDLWHPERGVAKVLPDYGRGGEKLPVYKMPHLRTWAVSGNLACIPGVGRHEVILVEIPAWKQVGKIPVAGQPVFIMAAPDGRRLWVNFAFPDYDTVQIIDVESRSIIRTLKPGAIARGEAAPCAAGCGPEAHGGGSDAAAGAHSLPLASSEGPLLPARGGPVLHMEFTPRGEQVWLSLRDANRVEIYDTATFEKLGELPVDSPSGIFFSARAHRFGL